VNSHLVKDLNGDSLDLVELAMVIEDHFNIVLDDSELDAVRTVDDLYTILKKRRLD
jgi:acyl carrier protein